MTIPDECDGECNVGWRLLLVPRGCLSDGRRGNRREVGIRGWARVQPLVQGRIFFGIHDPTTLNQQGADVGTQYRSAIYTHSEEQADVARGVLDSVDRDGPWDAPIVTEIAPLDVFYPAEDYHQDYYQKNPLRYKFYRFNCGRDQRLAELWSVKS